jgi:hypothetical protein
VRRDPSVSLLPGAIVTVTGMYLVVHSTGHEPLSDCLCVKGAQLPSCPECSASYTLIRPVTHLSAPVSTLQELYDSEISFELRGEWAAGFEWKLGDRLNGYSAQGHCDTCDEALRALARAASENYPTSEFVQGRKRIA